MGSVVVHGKVARGARCRRSVLTACRLHTEGQFTHRAVFLTLTYRPGVEWKPNHVRALNATMEKWCQRRGIAYRCTWVMELTKAGRPHYHAIIFLPKALSLPKPDKRGWWPHGMTKIETARHAVGYLAKYASKCINTAFHAPKGARITGCRGLSPEARDEKSWWMKPKWVRDVLPIEDRPIKVLGGYMSRTTGEFLASSWSMVDRDKGWTWFEMCDDAPQYVAKRPSDAFNIIHTRKLPDRIQAALDAAVVNTR